MERIETLQFMLAMVAEDNRLLRTVLKETGNEAPLPAEWAEPVVPLGEPDSAAPSSSRTVRFRCIRCDGMTPHLVIDDIHGWFDKSFRAVLREARQSHQETVDEIREHYNTVESQLSSDNARLKKALQTAASCHEKNWRGEAELRAKNRNLKQELAAARRQIADLEEKVASFSTSR
ncbi:hypothetical protein PBRA_004178 [Plasmodiophora brassicae]|nr:hypothetical protein PBRA_004178 [Plasmodiophora brassicae]